MELSIFYIPAPSRDEAMRIGQALLEEKRVACIHVFRVESAYPWHGAVQQDAEYILLLKTLPACEASVMNTVRTMHPYEVPAILHWRVHANDEYIQWMQSEIKLPPP